MYRKGTSSQFYKILFSIQNRNIVSNLNFNISTLEDKNKVTSDKLQGEQVLGVHAS